MGREWVKTHWEPSNQLSSWCSAILLGDFLPGEPGSRFLSWYQEWGGPLRIQFLMYFRLWLLPSHGYNSHGGAYILSLRSVMGLRSLTWVGLKKSCLLPSWYRWDNWEWQRLNGWPGHPTCWAWGSPTSLKRVLITWKRSSRQHFLESWSMDAQVTIRKGYWSCTLFLGIHSLR